MLKRIDEIHGFNNKNGYWTKRVLLKDMEELTKEYLAKILR